MKYFLPLILPILPLCSAWGNDSINVLDEVSVVDHAVKAPLTLLPLDVDLIDNIDFEQRGAANVLPVLRNLVPGLFVTERGIAGYGVSGGAAGNVSIRGVGGGNKVLFLIDGQPQWAGVFGHSLPDTYVVNNIERVEVVSGPSSLLYGSGAVGGSVNLITKRADPEGWSGSVGASAGSYATQHYKGSLAYGHHGFRVLVAASYDRSDGSRDNMGYWLANQYASLGYDIGKHWEVGANVMLTSTKAHNPGSVDLGYDLAMWSKMFRTTTALYVKNRYANSSGGIQAYYNWGRHKIDDGIQRGAPRTYLFHSKDYNMGVTAYQTVRPWVGNDLSAGVDFKHYGGETWNSAKADGAVTPGVDKSVNEIGGYLMTRQSLFQDLFTVNAGVRLEHSSQFGNQWTPLFGLLRQTDNYSIKFNYSQGFRSPNIRELYMYASRNPDLQPEEMDNFELEYRQRVLGGRIDFGIALFYINGDNLISAVTTPEGTTRNINIGKFINKGVEADIAFRATQNWSFAANYAYLHTDKVIEAAPRHKIFGSVTWTSGQWEVALESLSVFHLHTGGADTESYSLLNAHVAYSLKSLPLTLFVNGDNLTATKYEINHGFPMPRATVLAGFRLSL